MSHMIRLVNEHTGEILMLQHIIYVFNNYIQESGLAHAPFEPQSMKHVSLALQ